MSNMCGSQCTLTGKFWWWTPHSCLPLAQTLQSEIFTKYLGHQHARAGITSPHAADALDTAKAARDAG